MAVVDEGVWGTSGVCRSTASSASTKRYVVVRVRIVCFFFSSRRRHTRFDCDWSSDVCSSDLQAGQSALVLWGTAWRDDQKEAHACEEMASRAISRFFGSSSCYAKVAVLRSDRKSVV